MKSKAHSPQIPIDIKLLNELTYVLVGLFFLLVTLTIFQYIIKYKIENLYVITIKGNITHTDSLSVKNIINSINENFYSIDLAKVKNMFESTPWINHAVVKRVYPNQMEVMLNEYKQKAVWGARDELKLVDDMGTIFEANAAQDDYESLPHLIGPDGQARLMLSMYKEVSSALSPLKNGLQSLELNARGSWIATLEGGARIELGRGNTVDVIDRVTKFSVGAERMLTKLNKKSIDIQYVDLRHSDGYAMRMHGISTLDLTIAATSLKK